MPERNYAEIEARADAALAAIRKLTTDPEILRHAEAMEASVSNHARENREQDTRIRQLERQLHTSDRSVEKGLEKIRRAAAARAEIAESAVTALRELLPEAKAQAKKGKPALLRMILRASR
jgi:hypothetical protein